MQSRQSRAGRTARIVCCIICLGLIMRPMDLAAYEPRNGREEAVWPEAPGIAGEAGIVMEASTGVVLFDKNMHDAHYPASITKIMTALLAVENCKMDEIVTVPPEAVYMEDKGTHIALDAGEQLTVEECLYAVMLASANDAAYALAEHAGGTMEHFIRMMNEKARALGCQDTNFTNPHGLPDERHVTSAYDMALIMRAALENEMFRTVSGTSYYEILPSAQQKDQICMYNHHKMIGKGAFYRADVFAGKNGYTDVAQNTLVTCARRGDMELICVVMKAQGTQIYEDTAALLDYGLDHFSRVMIEGDAQYFQEILEKTAPAFVDCPVSVLPENIFVLLPAGMRVDDLDVVADYENGAGNVTIAYYFADHFLGKAEMATAAAPAKPQDREEATAFLNAALGEKEGKEKVFPWKYIVSGMILFAAGVCVGIMLHRLCGNMHRKRRGGRRQRMVRRYR